MKLLKNKTHTSFLIMLVVFVSALLFAVLGFQNTHSSLNVLLNFRYLLFLVLMLSFTLFYSFYLFRRNVKRAPFSILFAAIYSLVLFLGFVSSVEILTNIRYMFSIDVFALFSVLLSIFFSYIVFGLAAKDFYTRSKKATVVELITSTLRKHAFFAINALLGIGLIFFCTIILGLPFFMGFTFLLLAVVFIAALAGFLFSPLLHLVCCD